MMRKKLLAMLIIAVSLSATEPVLANYLTNGSFESPNVVPNNGYVNYYTGSTSIPGWTVVGGVVSLCPDTWMRLPASDGHQYVDLTGYNEGFNKGVKSDTVTTEIGAIYQLSFDIGAYRGFGTASLSVSINGATPSIYTNLYTGGLMDWETKSLSWVANSNNANFTFLGDSANNGSDSVIGLDNVVFVKTNPVPVPTTMLLLVSGLAGLAGLRR